MALASIGVAALGFLSPDSHGALLTAMVVIYLVLGFAAGYTAVHLLTLMPPPSDTRQHWLGTSVKVACAFPAFASVVLAVINTALASTGSRSSGVMPFSLFFSLFILWFLISVPLSILGGGALHYTSPFQLNLSVSSLSPPKSAQHHTLTMLNDELKRELVKALLSGYTASLSAGGSDNSDDEEYGSGGGGGGGKGKGKGNQLRSNQIPRQIPPTKLPVTWIALAAGVFPFGTAFIEIYYIMTSLWQGLKVVHFPAQRKRFLWDRGCVQGLYRECIGRVRGSYGVSRVYFVSESA
jgi:hypothetical protein